MRWTRRLTGWLLLAVLLIGPPVVLVTVVGWPFPHRWPTGQQARQWLDQPLTEPTLIAALAVTGWSIWATLVAAVALQVLGRLRRARRWLRYIRLPTPVQATASGILGAAVFGAPTATSPVPQQPQAPEATATGHDTPPDVDAPIAPDRHDDQTPQREAGGVLLPGGQFIPADLAEAVAAAATVVWARRRRAYLPRPPAPGLYGDADLTALPPTVTAVQSALQATDDHPSPAARPGTGTPTHPHDFPTGGVGLSGPGADAAARGVLVTALMTRRHAPADHPTVITTRVDLTALLGDRADPVSEAAGLVVTEDLPAALAVAHGSFTAPGGSPVRDQLDPAYPVVLLTTVPTDPRMAEQLADLLRGTGRRRVIGVLRGAWPPGATWDITINGTTGTAATDGPRLCALSATAAGDLLALHGQAHPSATPPTGRPPHPPGNPAARATPPSQVVPDRPAQAGARPRLRLLGTVEVDHEGTAVPVRRTAALQALVYLAVHQDGATSHDLARAIWPHLRPHSTAGRLYTTISELRRTLHTTCGRQVIDRTGERYRLNPGHVDVDLWHQRDAVHHAATALTPIERHHALHTIISSPGELACGQTWPWLDQPRHAVRRHLLDAYTTLAAAEADPHRALRLLRGAIGVDPLNEDVHHRAMHALAATGDTTAIPALLATYTQRLTTTGLQPSDALRSLAQRLTPHLPA